MPPESDVVPMPPESDDIPMPPESDVDVQVNATEVPLIA